MFAIAKRKILRLVRIFHASSIYNSNVDKVLKVVSQKAYTKLPVARQLPDGSSASALKAWGGGLESQEAFICETNPASDSTIVLPERKISTSDTAKFIKPSKKSIRNRKADGPVNLKDTAESCVPVTLDAVSIVTRKRRLRGRPCEGISLPTISDLGNPPASEVLPCIEAKIRPQNQLAREIWYNLNKFPHCILLTRVGNFYESYFEQATEVAQLLSIKLTKRTWDKQEVLMCGFPIMHLDKYLKILVRHNKKFVALCEEFRRDPPEEGFERRVVRVLTPGTLTEESIIDPYENNYLLAISDVSTVASSSGNDIGLAWIDVSTGEFFTQTSTLDYLKDDLARITPREIVLSSKLQNRPNTPLHQAVRSEEYFLSFCDEYSENVYDSFSTPATEDTLESCRTDTPLTIQETSAIGLLTSFLRNHLLDHMPALSQPSRQVDFHRMHIDSHTLKSLEIREGIREGGTTGSLLSAIKRTITNSGTRLLIRWLSSPSTSISEIQSRQSLVSFFVQRAHLRNDIMQYLRRLEDTSRIVQRFLLRKGDVSDLLTIKETIALWQLIKSRIEIDYADHRMNVQCPTLRRLLNSICDMSALASRIGMAVEHRQIPLNDEHPLTIMEATDLPDARENVDNIGNPVSWIGQVKFTIRPSFSPELESLHQQLYDGHTARQRLEKELQERYAAPSLTLRLSGKMGVHVHIAKPSRDSEKVENSTQFVLLNSSGSSKAFFNRTWYILGAKIVDITTQILAAEKHAFDILRHEVKTQALYLRKNARVIDELDVIISFAQLASDMKFVRPILNESTDYEVINGRHPSVEMGLLHSGRPFTPNTVSLCSTSRMHVITGPNMAGKSTLLRQTAIIVILAQIGSFVPADSATLGVVDRLFSRIGAKDDLFRDRSTFMVEMLETADILKNATERSLVIMDEVGRGTTVQDGLAIAFATVYHLYRLNRSRVLFATHFHELADMLGYAEQGLKTGPFSGVDFFRTDVHITVDGYITYSHRLRPGVSRDSHGLKVAALAGIPPSALKVAEDTLKCMKEECNSLSKSTQLKAVVSDVLSRYV